MAKPTQKHDAWSPGLTSEIPAALLPMVTLFRTENSDVSYSTAKEAADFCGLKAQDMAALNLRRLIVHELLIRVTADLYVPDGPSYEELGLNLRSMAAQILTRHIDPEMPALEQAFADFRASAAQAIATLLSQDLYDRPAPEPAARTGFFARFTKPPAAAVPTDPPERLAIADWAAATPADPLTAACLHSLRTIVEGMVRQRGRLFADRDVVQRLALAHLCNSHGSKHAGRLIQPIIASAAAAEGYRFLPFQSAPFVMNVKGASAAGKSTLRPLQRELAERMGIKWQDFALISPDYWRKFLLDYSSLGDDYKYAAMLTGQELEIIDKKLDRYMEEKALRSEMPHLLIDRFRFDSFSAAPSQSPDGNLLSRFGDTVFMFFVITPPADTVERAWKRGIETGRYKAVDDLLYHNIEAYTGMTQLFLSWVKRTRQKIHFEFLDNSVPYGTRPRTIAFGWNEQVTILDPDAMRRLNRYQHVNIDARRPQDVLVATDGSEGDILADCIGKIDSVTFADGATLDILGQTHDGKCTFQTDAYFSRLDLAQACGDGGPSDAQSTPPSPVDFPEESRFTIGSWAASPAP